MGRFWSSSSNKTKLPQLLTEQLVDLLSRRCLAEFVVIGIGGESAQHCKCVHNARHASVGSWYRHRRVWWTPCPTCAARVNSESVRIVLLSPDTDVICTGTILLENVSELRGQYTVYAIARTLGYVYWAVWGSSANTLMGCVKSRKLGTADPIVYFGQFGKQINEAQLFGIMLLAEHCLVKVLNQGTSCTPIWTTFTIGSTAITKTRQFSSYHQYRGKQDYTLCAQSTQPVSTWTVSQVPVLTLVCLSLNEMMLIVCFFQEGMYSCCPTISHKVAHAQSVPRSDGPAGRLLFRVAYSASVIMDSNTHLVEIHINWMPVVYMTGLFV